MNPESTPARDWRLPLLLIPAVVFALDRLTKLWILRHLKPSDVVAVIPGWFHLTHVYNNGAAFSIFEDTRSPETVRWMLIAFSIFAIAAVFALFWNVGRRISITSVALAMILGGAIGNLYDRFSYHFVIDFLAFSHWGYHYPDFNVADSCIVTGACLLLLEAIRGVNPIFTDAPKNESSTSGSATH
jgi:signal peptidase II